MNKKELLTTNTNQIWEIKKLRAHNQQLLDTNQKLEKDLARWKVEGRFFREIIETLLQILRAKK